MPLAGAFGVRRTDSGRGAAQAAAAAPPARAPPPKTGGPSGAPSDGSSVSRWSVEELSAVGAAMLSSEDAAGGWSTRYRFFGASPGELILSDVPQLLNDYCALAQRHEALLRGVQLMLETTAAAPAAPAAPAPAPAGAQPPAPAPVATSQPEAAQAAQASERDGTSTPPAAAVGSLPDFSGLSLTGSFDAGSGGDGAAQEMPFAANGAPLNLL